MPTGSGKTRVAMELICHYLNSNYGLQVLWLADRVELCEQATETFMSVWPHLGRFDLKLYCLWGNREPPKRVKGSTVMVTMYQKIRGLLTEQNSLLKPDLIVMDEAHNVLAPTYQKVIEKLIDPMEKQTRLVGLTATPGRTFKNSEDNRKLSDFFNRRIVEVDSGDKGVIDFLQEKRILARAVRKPLNTNIRYTLTPEEWKKFSKTFSDYPGELLERIANDQRRNLIISKELFNLASQNRQVLYFGTSVEQSRMLCGLMLSKGHAAAHIDGNTPIGYRSDVVNKFRKGEIKFIFNYGIFATGFDAPNIDTIFIARPTTSIVLYSQMLGRGMRGPEIGGTDEFLLVDVVDMISTEVTGLDNVYEYFSDYWEEIPS
jgi:superfamily II DNA or RNA helicase